MSVHLLDGIWCDPMARQEIITDDLTGQPGAEEVVIALGDRTWTVDLGPASRKKLDKALAPFIANATATGGAPARSSRSRSNKSALSAQERTRLREWAATNDVALPSRGRIPNAIIEQYRSTRRK